MFANGTEVICYSSVEHPKCDLVATVGNVRGEVKYSGWVLEKSVQPNQAQASFIAAVDVKGSVPSSVAASVARDQALKVKDLKKFVRDTPLAPFIAAATAAPPAHSLPTRPLQRMISLREARGSEMERGAAATAALQRASLDLPPPLPDCSFADALGRPHQRWAAVSVAMGWASLLVQLVALIALIADLYGTQTSTIRDGGGYTHHHNGSSGADGSGGWAALDARLGWSSSLCARRGMAVMGVLIGFLVQLPFSVFGLIRSSTPRAVQPPSMTGSAAMTRPGTPARRESLARVRAPSYDTRTEHFGSVPPTQPASEASCLWLRAHGGIDGCNVCATSCSKPTVRRP